MSRDRAILVAIFALLFFSMQREAQVHALVHAGGVLHPAREQAMQAPAVDGSCLECSLLAGGPSALVGDLPSSPSPMVASPRAVTSMASRSLAAPSFYSSRAPPPLL